jgi:hypothetical protein
MRAVSSPVLIVCPWWFGPNLTTLLIDKDLLLVIKLNDDKKESCIDAIGLELILIVATALSYLRNVDVSYDKPSFLVFSCDLIF